MVVSVFSTTDIQYLQVYNFVLIIHLQSGKEGGKEGGTKNCVHVFIERFITTELKIT